MFVLESIAENSVFLPFLMLVLGGFVASYIYYLSETLKKREVTYAVVILSGVIFLFSLYYITANPLIGYSLLALSLSLIVSYVLLTTSSVVTFLTKK